MPATKNKDISPVSPVIPTYSLFTLPATTTKDNSDVVLPLYAARMLPITIAWCFNQVLGRDVAKAAYRASIARRLPPQTIKSQLTLPVFLIN